MDKASDIDQSKELNKHSAMEEASASDTDKAANYADKDSIGPRPGDRLDRARERELFRYFRPKSSRDHVGQLPLPLISECPSSPDAYLSAMAKLVTMQLGVRRCFISVVDRTSMYVVSESTAKTSLTSAPFDGEELDKLIFGCMVLPNPQSLCHNVLNLPYRPGVPQVFQVTNLAEDDRFCDLPYVKNHPSLRFYAGTPIRTRRGVDIGAVAAADHASRPPLDEEQLRLLAHIAEQVMEYLEMRRQIEEKNRLQRMSRGLNAFVQGRDNLSDESTPRSFLGLSRRATSLGSQIGRLRPPSRSSHRSAAVSAKASSNPQSRRDSAVPQTQSDVDQGVDRDPNPEERQPLEKVYTRTLTRAADILRASLNLSLSGGVVIMDASGDLSGVDDCSQVHSVDTPSSERGGFAAHECHRLGHTSAALLSSSLGMHNTDMETEGPVKIDMRTMSRKSLHAFLRRYPGGKLWEFDEDNVVISSDDDGSFPQRRGSSRKSSRSAARRRKLTEAEVLRCCFPGVRYVIFVPIWDATKTDNSAVCFCFTTSQVHRLSKSVDLSFLSAFSNNITTELSRVAALDADRKKADFIGSISHELRSPLHGILASAEFLAESVAGSASAGLVDTIDICGRTLLDTINHVLEFSRINAFESQIADSNMRVIKSSSEKRKATVPGSLPGALSLLGTVDVAAVTEEVIEGIFAAREHSDFKAVHVDSIPSEDKSPFTDPWGNPSWKSPPLVRRRTQLEGKDIDIILDFEYHDYTFVTHPGALRRIIMNIFTNSMKYTESGMILIRLQTSEEDGTNDGLEGDMRRAIILTIRDTGRGMSPSYLRTRLYTPFAQENTLNPGTGLGLSIVRSIIRMMGGNIDIQSELGVGTQVRITLPLKAPGEEGAPVLPGTNPDPTTAKNDTYVQKLRQVSAGKKVAMFNFDDDVADDKVFREFVKALEYFIVTWYGFTWAFGATRLEDADVIIVRQSNQDELVEQLAGRTSASVVVLCSTMLQHADRLEQKFKTHYLLRPFGPYRLAKSLYACFSPGSMSTQRPSEDITFGAAKSKSFQVDSDGTLIEDMGGALIESEDARSDYNVMLPGSYPISRQATGFFLNRQRTRLSFAVTESVASIREEPPAEKRRSLVRSPSEGKLWTALGTPQTGPPKEEAVSSGKMVNETKELPKSDQSTSTSAANAPKENQGRPTEMVGESKKTLTKSATVADRPAERPKRPTLPRAPSSNREPRSPRVLLVEDNTINLMLLQTFMKKRKYTDVDKAENGQLAVDAARSKEYDIIFMDISMPVKNGFEATREIRQLESLSTQQRESAVEAFKASSTYQNMKEGDRRAFIVALTGLASNDDQREAVESGVDLFMTKPVSFKNVGQLLDSWEANEAITPTA